MGFNENVKGNNSATPTVAVKPGKLPKIIPRITPAIQRKIC